MGTDWQHTHAHMNVCECVQCVPVWIYNGTISRQTRGNCRYCLCARIKRKRLSKQIYVVCIGKIDVKAVEQQTRQIVIVQPKFCPIPIKLCDFIEKIISRNALKTHPNTNECVWMWVQCVPVWKYNGIICRQMRRYCRYYLCVRIKHNRSSKRTNFQVKGWVSTARSV